MRQQRLGRQRSLDQVSGRRCLGDTLLAGPAGILRTHGDDHPKLRRNDIEPLGAVFADANHLAAAARALDALGFDHLRDARQVGRQPTDVAFGGRTLRPRRPRRARRRLFLGLGERALQFLQGELELVGVKLFGLLPVDRPPQLVEKMFETAVLLGERDDLGAQRLDNASGASLLKAAVAIAQGRVLGAKRLKCRLLAVDRSPQGRRKR